MPTRSWTFGLAEWRDVLAAKLNVAQKKRLELARALAARPRLLLLDEVLAGLNPSEIAGMVQVVNKIRGQGVTIFIITHVMRALLLPLMAAMSHASRRTPRPPRDSSWSPKAANCSPQ